MTSPARRWTQVLSSAVFVVCCAAAAEAQSVSLSGTPIFHQGDSGSYLAPDITLTCGGGYWSSSSWIHLIIPDSVNLIWNTGVTGTSTTPPAATISGAMAANCNPPLTITYGGTGGNKCCIIKIFTTFTANMSATIHGLQFTGVGAPSSGPLYAYWDGSSVFGTANYVIDGSHPITIASNPTVTSLLPGTSTPANQTISPNATNAPVTAYDLQITDGINPGIWAADGLRITIPAGLDMTWNPAQPPLTATGTANAKIDLSNFTFEDSSKTIVLALKTVTTFAPGDSITLQGLQFSNVNSDSGPLSLIVTTNGPTHYTNGTDTQTKTIFGSPTLASQNNQAFTVGDPSTAAAALTITASPGTPSKITQVNGISLIIPPALNLTWDPTIQTLNNGLSFSGTASSHVTSTPTTTIVTYSNGNKTALISLISDFGSGQTLTVTGLRFTSFTAFSAPVSLTVNTGVAVATDSKTIGIGAPSITDASAPPGQIFSVGLASTTQPCLDITVSDDNHGVNTVNRIKAASGIRIRIPATSNLHWDTTVTSVTFPAGTAAANMKTGANVSYDDPRTAVIAVMTDFAGAGQNVTLRGLVFKDFSLPMTPASLQLGVNGAAPPGTMCATDNRIVAIGGSPSLSSLANQAFTFNDPATLAQQLTVTDAAGVPTITMAKKITLTIPAGFPMQWDTAIQKTTDGLAFSGSAWTAGDVTPDGSGNLVTYQGTQTAVINVTTNFAAKDTLIVSGLKFQSFTAAHDPSNLQLFVDPLGSPVPDAQTIAIGAPTITLSANQGFGIGDPSTVLNTVTLTDDPNVPRILASTQIRIHIPAGLNMAWNTAIQSRNNGLVFGGTGAGNLSGSPSLAIVSYPNASTALVAVQTDFSAGQTLTIAGLQCTNFTGPASGPLGLGLEVNALNTLCSTSPQTLSIGARPNLLSFRTQDLDGNGSIDHLVLTFDQNINGTTSSVLLGTAFTITNPSLVIARGSASGATVTFTLVESGSPNTGVTPTLTYDPATGNLVGTNGLGTSFTGPLIGLDGAPPVVTGITEADTNGNGYLDTVTITWSEALLPGQENISDWKLIDANGTTNLLQGLTNTNMVISGNTITFHLADNSGTTGLPRFLYTPSTIPTILDRASPPNAAASQTNNFPPVANPGQDLSLPPSKITLDASGSSDPNGQPLTFSWIQTGGSPTWTLDNPNIARPSFLGTTEGTYTFQVTVSDALSSSTATVHITIINIPPGADAGSNQTQQPGNGVYLVALGSSDGNGDPLTFTWTQLSGATPAAPPVQILAGNAVMAFTAPTPAAAGSPSAPNNIMVFQLTASDGTNQTTSQVSIRLTGPGGVAPPTANAGPDQVAFVGSTVQLDGSLSIDPAGHPSYTWTSTTPLSSTTIVNPTFVPSLPGIYTFTLTVFDATTGLESFPSQVRVLVQAPSNQAPVAVASRLLPAGEIVIGDQVVLDGSASVDPEGAALTYAWTQLSGPRVVIVRPASVQSNWTPVIAGTYTFQLIVSDGVNLSLPTTVSMTVKTLPTDVTFTVTPSDGPGIVNGQALLTSSPLTFDVTTSDTSANFWFFYWDQLAGPSMNFNPLYGGSPNTFTFPFPIASQLAVGYYSFQVRATTHNAIVAKATISVVVNNPGVYTVPVAGAGPAQTATAGQTVTLDASGSTATAPAVFGSGLRAYWTQTGGPPVVLSNPYGVQPTFTPPAAGTYSFSLTVADATSPSAPGTVTVTVQPAPAAPVAQGGGGGGCGLGGELVVLLPLIWGASWLLRSRTSRRGVLSR